MQNRLVGLILHSRADSANLKCLCKGKNMPKVLLTQRDSKMIPSRLPFRLIAAKCDDHRLELKDILEMFQCARSREASLSSANPPKISYTQLGTKLVHHVKPSLS